MPATRCSRPDPVAAAAPDGRASPHRGSMLGEALPGRPRRHRRHARPHGARRSAPTVPAREWRDLYGALDCLRGRRDSPLLCRRRCASSCAAGRPVVGSAPGRPTRATADVAGGDRQGSRRRTLAAIDAAKAADAARRSARRWRPAASTPASPSRATRARNCSSPGCSTEAGAEVPYVGTALPAHRMERARPRLAHAARGTHVQYRASLEQDLAAMREVNGRTSRSARRRSCRRPRRAGIPAVYFTNMVSARPLFGAPGVGALARRSSKAQSRGPRALRAHGLLLRQASARGESTPATASDRRARRPHPGAKERYPQGARDAKARAEAHIPVGS